MAQYPEAVMAQIADPVTGTRLLKDYPSLHDLRKACDAAYDPIARETEREIARRQYLRSLPPPREKRTPEEQARVDEQIERWRRMRGFRCDLNPRGAAARAAAESDGQHAQRVKADLEARRARNEERSDG